MNLGSLCCRWVGVCVDAQRSEHSKPVAVPHLRPHHLGLSTQRKELNACARQRALGQVRSRLAASRGRRGHDFHDLLPYAHLHEVEISFHRSTFLPAKLCDPV